jgi:transcriptional regulator with XRE-family HTH domain
MIQKESKKIALRLLRERQEREWSQQELADKAGIDRKTVNRIENLHFSPSMETFLRLCNAMKVQAHEVLKG